MTERIILRRAPIISLLLLATILSACATTAEPAKETTQTKSSDAQGAPDSHSISKAEERKLLAQTQEDLEIVMSVRDDTTPLEKALSGIALKQMVDQVTAEKEQNRVKIRQYDDMRLQIENITKDIAGLRLTFNDQTSVVAADTSATVEKGSGESVELLLAVKKIKKRWKIIEIFSKELTPNADPRKEKGTS